jgi:acyl-CoA reductase-like NAD-dependent aldehyde dehydrogenase
MPRVWSGLNRRSREEHLKTYQHFIGGQYVDPLGGKWIDSMDPYRGEAWARIPQGCARDVDRAVIAASQAMQGPWSKMTPSARGKLMLKLAELVEANIDRLAEVGIEAIREYLETKSVWISMAEGSPVNPFVMR